MSSRVSVRVCCLSQRASGPYPMAGRGYQRREWNLKHSSNSGGSSLSGAFGILTRSRHSTAVVTSTQTLAITTRIHLHLVKG